MVGLLFWSVDRWCPEEGETSPGIEPPQSNTLQPKRSLELTRRREPLHGTRTPAPRHADGRLFADDLCGGSRRERRRPPAAAGERHRHRHFLFVSNHREGETV